MKYLIDRRMLSFCLIVCSIVLSCGAQDFRFKCKPRQGCDFASCDAVPPELMQVVGFNVELYRKLNDYHITCESENFIDLVKSLGGKKRRGKTGAKGEPGEAGHKGDKGSVGAKGDRGLKGASGKDGSTGTGIKGDPGVPGPKGNKGSIGPAGITGPKGSRGDNGAAGSTGPRGPVDTTLRARVAQLEIAVKSLQNALRQRWADRGP